MSSTAELVVDPAVLSAVVQLLPAGVRVVGSAASEHYVTLVVAGDDLPPEWRRVTLTVREKGLQRHVALRPAGFQE